MIDKAIRSIKNAVRSLISFVPFHPLARTVSTNA